MELGSSAYSTNEGRTSLSTIGPGDSQIESIAEVMESCTETPVSSLRLRRLGLRMFGEPNTESRKLKVVFKFLFSSFENPLSYSPEDCGCQLVSQAQPITESAVRENFNP